MNTTKTFNIYCDESTHLIHDGHPFMVLGYVSIAYNQIDMAKAQIKEIKGSEKSASIPLRTMVPLKWQGN